MRVAYCSDCHIEFGSLILNNDDNADVLILAGDTVIEHYLNDNDRFKFDIFFKDISNKFPITFIIAGNHEFYHGKWEGSLAKLRQFFLKYDNIEFMEDNSYFIDDIMFLGSTLWTDMGNNNPFSSMIVKNSMNDYRIIRNDAADYRKLNPTDTMIRHNKSLKFINSMLKNYTSFKTVVITHHSPSYKSVPDKYNNTKDMAMNDGYCSDLDYLMFKNPQIKYWIHGHTHTPFDYMINHTNVLCNPRGYIGHEHSADIFKLKYFDV